MRVLRSFVLLVACGGVFGAALVVPALGGPRNSPPNRIEIVTLNIEEAYSMDTRDLGSHFEIGNFVDRVIPGTPYLPDVLLMQEVNHETSGLIARELTRRTGQRYIVAVRPIRETTVERGNDSWHTETAILVNTKTMAVAKRGGFYAATYPDSATAPGVAVQVRRHAHILLRERGTGLEVPVASVHFARTRDMKSGSVSNYWRGVWAKNLESLMQRRYGASGPAKVSVVGGDFNMDRCFSGSFQTCNEAKFWTTFTSRPHDYTDSLYDLGLPIGVDILFTTGDPERGGWDEHGKFPESDRKRYYSDHRFRWLLVGPN